MDHVATTTAPFPENKKKKIQSSSRAAKLAMLGARSAMSGAKSAMLDAKSAMLDAQWAMLGAKSSMLAPSWVPSWPCWALYDQNRANRDRKIRRLPRKFIYR